MEKSFVCIVCPNSCKLKICDNNGDLSITGNKCKRGSDFAISELRSPTRSLTTTVRTVYKDLPYIPVRTKEEIPKNKVFDVIHELHGFILNHRVCCGDIIVNNVAGIRCNIIATIDIPENIK